MHSTPAARVWPSSSELQADVAMRIAMSEIT
jgi:hypothetical protein